MPDIFLNFMAEKLPLINKGLLDFLEVKNGKGIMLKKEDYK